MSNNISIDNYTFDKTAKTVTFTDYVSIRLDRILLIVNVTDDIIIYNFADPSLGGSVASNVLTLTYDTSAMDNTDKLLIKYDSTTPSIATMQNAAVASGNGTKLPVAGYATAVLNIVSSPAMSGGTTVNFEASVDDTTWVAITATQIGVTGSLATSTTADGDFRISCAGYKSLRARISGYSAGTVTVKGYASVAAGPTHAVSVDTGSGAGATIGTTSGAAVVTDATGTLQQYLRGIVSFFANLYNSTTNFLLVRNLQKDVYAAAVAFTISLNALATSTAGVGRQSTLLTSNTSRAALIYVKLKMGTTPTANTVATVYLIQGDGTITTDGAGASDAGLTVVNAPVLGQIICSATTTGALYQAVFDTRLVTPALGPQWGIAIVNSTGAALDASAGGTVDYVLIS
jgi:hypothetical protein